MLFLLTFTGFGLCLLAVFVSQRAQQAAARRRARSEQGHLPPPSGRPTPVPAEPVPAEPELRPRDRAPRSPSMR